MDTPTELTHVIRMTGEEAPFTESDRGDVSRSVDVRWPGVRIAKTAKIDSEVREIRWKWGSQVTPVVPAMLDDFIDLERAETDEFVRFVRRWGPLLRCECGRSAHNGPRRDCIRGVDPFGEPEGAESLALWRASSAQLSAFVSLGLVLITWDRQETPPISEDDLYRRAIRATAIGSSDGIAWLRHCLRDHGTACVGAEIVSPASRCSADHDLYGASLGRSGSGVLCQTCEHRHQRPEFSCQRFPTTLDLFLATIGDELIGESGLRLRFGLTGDRPPRFQVGVASDPQMSNAWAELVRLATRTVSLEPAGRACRNFAECGRSFVPAGNTKYCRRCQDGGVPARDRKRRSRLRNTAR